MARGRTAGGGAGEGSDAGAPVRSRSRSRSRTRREPTAAAAPAPALRRRPQLLSPAKPVRAPRPAPARTTAAAAKKPQLSPELLALKERMAAERARLTVWRRPLRTLQLFGSVAADGARAGLGYALGHPLTLYAGLPCAALWLAALQFEGPHRALMDEAALCAQFAVWWVGLGVLSSVGLGTGMHSGLLFLFPHIMKVAMAASQCRTTDFAARNNMWFRADADLFVCPEGGAHAAATFGGVFLKVLPAALLWGAGTAIGEIPPYALSRAARIAGAKCVRARADPQNERARACARAGTRSWTRSRRATRRPPMWWAA